MEKEDEREPYLEQLIAEAAAPLSGVLPADQLETLRHVLRQSVEDDADLTQLHQAARPRKVQANTREEPVGAEPEGAAQEPAKIAPIRRSGGAA